MLGFDISIIIKDRVGAFISFERSYLYKSCETPWEKKHTLPVPHPGVFRRFFFLTEDSRDALLNYGQFKFSICMYVVLTAISCFSLIESSEHLGMAPWVSCLARGANIIMEE